MCSQVYEQEQVVSYLSNLSPKGLFEWRNSEDTADVYLVSVSQDAWTLSWAAECSVASLLAAQVC